MTGAAAIQTAAASLAAANGVSGATGSGSSGGSGWLGLIASGASAYFGGGAGGAAGASTYTGAYGFAEGGWPGGQVRGPGTPTSDSIPIWVSDTEFITRGAVVQQPGMLDLLSDINARGWAAIDDLMWHGAARHSTGGLANVPAPALPSPGLANTRLAEPAKAAGATLNNKQNFYLVDDPNRIGDVMSGPIGHEAIAVAISREPGKFRQLLGLNP
jgi:hypothetical protein